MRRVCAVASGQLRAARNDSGDLMMRIGAVRYGDDDIVRWVSRLIAADLPTSAENTAALLRIERRMRIEWGGKRPYISKRVAQNWNAQGAPQRVQTQAGRVQVVPRRSTQPITQKSLRSDDRERG